MEYNPNFTVEQHDVWHELQDIKEWFDKTDYIPNKIVCGEWQTTDKRWLQYIEERAVKRTRQDEIMKILGE